MKNFLIILTLFLLCDILVAQQWQWPEHSKNLTVLPSSIGAKDLSRTMKSFTGALGVRCIYCHVGEEGKSLAEFDFVSDAKPEKNKARIMMAMVQNINSKYLSTFHENDEKSVQVNCQTCHRGSSLPIMLEDKLKHTIDEFGIDSALHQYRVLREEYYGGFTYNFNEEALLRLTDKILEDSTKGFQAVAVLNLNIEMYPKFPYSYIYLGGYYEERGDIDSAIQNYQKALTLNPKNPRLKSMIDRLQKK